MGLGARTQEPLTRSPGDVIGAVVVIVLLAALWRLVSFRNTGSQGLLRNLPADGVHGWRHGVYRYND